MTSQLTVPELRDTLSSLSLSSQGKKEQLQKRLRKAQRRIRLAEEAAERGASRGTEQDDGVWRPKYRRYLVLDVEATCEEAIYRGGPFVYPNESKCAWQEGHTLRWPMLRSYSSPSNSHRAPRCPPGMARRARALNIQFHHHLLLLLQSTEHQERRPTSPHRRLPQLRSPYRSPSPLRLLQDPHRHRPIGHRSRSKLHTGDCPAPRLDGRA